MALTYIGTNGARYTIIRPRSLREQEEYNTELVKRPDPRLWTSAQKKRNLKYLKKSRVVL